MQAKLTNQKYYFKSLNRFGMNAVLYIDGVKTANIHDNGDGSEMLFNVVDQEKFTALETAVSKMPLIYFPEFDIKISIDVSLFISILDHAQANPKSHFAQEVKMLPS